MGGVGLRGEGREDWRLETEITSEFIFRAGRRGALDINRRGNLVRI